MVLEEALDLSSDRLLMMMMMTMSRCVKHALKIITNYSVLPDDGTSKVSKRVGILIIV
jgi:hypothetical protein